MHDHMSSLEFKYSKILLEYYMLASRIDTFIYFAFSERALLNRLMLQLHKMDSDVLVGHNISGFDLDVLLHRSQVGIWLVL
jgi:DNA polymerase elongation subunit (family B)